MTVVRCLPIGKRRSLASSFASNCCWRRSRKKPTRRGIPARSRGDRHASPSFGLNLKGIGPEFAAVPRSRGLSRDLWIEGRRT